MSNDCYRKYAVLKELKSFGGLYLTTPINAWSISGRHWSRCRKVLLMSRRLPKI